MAILEVKELETHFYTERGVVRAVNKVSFDLEKGKVLGIVGESGSGKSVTAYSILQILPPGAKIAGGSVKLSGEELIGIGEDRMKKIRGNKISIIFQDPMTSLNPTLKIGFQIEEAIKLHTGLSGQDAKKRACEMLSLVGITNPENRLRSYPHEFSGGMRQRVMIAMALACEPDILIADEPTTALDVTVQEQILSVLTDIRKKLGTAIIMITHDMGVVAKTCDEVIVMYAGGICEAGSCEEIFYNPHHEYTKGLLASIPRVGISRLESISGSAPDLTSLGDGCPFAPRCESAMRICLKQFPKAVDIGNEHYARCFMNQKKIIEGTVSKNEK